VSELRPFESILASVAEFYVKGTKILLVDFDVGDSWAGLLPISSHANETRKVCPCAYTLHTKSMLITASFSFGIFLQLRMVAKTTLYFGEHLPITTCVGADTDRRPIARTNGGPGCLSLEGWLHPIPHIGAELWQRCICSSLPCGLHSPMGRASLCACTMSWTRQQNNLLGDRWMLARDCTVARRRWADQLTEVLCRWVHHARETCTKEDLPIVQWLNTVI
jgi:hypothetical protein